jgi:ubiquinone biosynthesis monooxygenase Coq7
MTQRTLTRFDRALVELERALGAIFEPEPVAVRPSPAEHVDERPLDDAARRHAAGLMRVNHVGEVCAQALYFGQAAVAHDERQRTRMLEAASEETDHLAWCGERLRELDSRPSFLNPLW